MEFSTGKWRVKAQYFSQTFFIISRAKNTKNIWLGEGIDLHRKDGTFLLVFSPSLEYFCFFGAKTQSKFLARMQVMEVKTQV